MQTLIKAIRTGGSGEEVELKASRDGDLRIAQYLPPFAMLCAAGKIFAFDTSGGTAVAPSNSMPALDPAWSIYNANPGGGAHLVLIHVGVMSESGSMGLGLGIVATVGIGTQTATTANYGSATVSCLDGTSKIPNAFIANGVNIIGTQPAWTYLDARDQLGVVAVGTGVVARPNGQIAAPPKNSIFLEIVGLLGVPAAKFDITVVVAQVQLDVA